MSVVRKILGPALLAVGAIPIHWAFTMITRVYRRQPWEIYALAGLGPLGALRNLVRRRDLASLLSLGIALGGVGFVHWYFSRYAVYPQREVYPGVGDKFPSFALTTSTNDAVASDDLRGDRFVMLCYRGAWCPFCITQLNELRTKYDEISDRGVKVFAVSVDSPEMSELLRKELRLDITFLADQAGELLDALDVSDDDGLFPGTEIAGFGSQELGRAIYMPTVFVIDEEGVVRWVHRTDSYRVRPNADDVIEAIDTVFTPA